MNNYINQMKLIGPSRNQMEMQINCLDTLLPHDHKARAVWQFVEEMNTDICFAYVNTFIGGDGRSTTSPKIIFALWLYSIMDGNFSGRKLEELCKNHNAYKWLAGGAPINRSMLNEFRSKDQIKFDELLTNCLAVMLKAGLIDEQDFAQDGTRVKANAGMKSFKRKESLEKLKAEISTYIKILREEECKSIYESREKDKKIRIEQERLHRVKAALEIFEKEKIIKQENTDKRKKKISEEDLNNIRASTTDPEARKMKMGDGGYRLAYNVQFATGIKSRVIFGVDVTTGLDPRTSPIMMAQVYLRLAKLGATRPRNWVGDAAYSSKEDINLVAQMFPNCRYYAPPQVNRGVDPKKHRKYDTDAVKKWRDSIGTEEVSEIYKHRSSTAEFSNAQVKNKGLTKFLVRGLKKVLKMATFSAIAQNVNRYLNLLKEKKMELVSD